MSFLPYALTGNILEKHLIFACGRSIHDQPIFIHHTHRTSSSDQIVNIYSARKFPIYIKQMQCSPSRISVLITGEHISKRNPSRISILVIKEYNIPSYQPILWNKNKRDAQLTMKPTKGQFDIAVSRKLCVSRK